MPTVLITGGHSGIGLECSRELARRKCDIILAGRSPERMEVVARELTTAHGVRVFMVSLDTGSLASVRRAAAEVRTLLDDAHVGGLDAILCNAGVGGTTPVTYTPDGYETTFATNHLGHFLLVNLLIDRLDERGRVVFTASGTHDPDTGDGRFGSVVEPDANALAHQGKTHKAIGAQNRYSTSKLCNVLCAYELHRRLRRSELHIASIAFDPGGIPESSLGRHLPRLLLAFIRSRFAKWLMKRMGVNVGNLSVAGVSLAKLAVDPTYADASGKYYQADERTMRERKSSALSYDPGRAAKLWSDSEALVHLQPDEKPSRLRSVD